MYKFIFNRTKTDNGIVVLKMDAIIASIVRWCIIIALPGNYLNILKTNVIMNPTMKH